MEYEEQDDEVRFFLPTGDKHILRRVCMATLNRYSDDSSKSVSWSSRGVKTLMY